MERECAVLDHGPLTEWVENRPGGIEQGWTIDERPEGPGPLRIALAVSGGFEPSIGEGGRSATFASATTAIRYGGLRAWDSLRRELLVRFAWIDEDLGIEVADEKATYPLTIDPTLAWMAESDQAFATFGVQVAAAGDVNGDGYGDVIVGSQGYDNGQEDEGRAFVYYGSPSGLSASPNWTAESNQPSAYFGASVSTAGDVNGDGYDDVIVGAFFYDNGQQDEGRAYVYYGSAGGLSTSPAWTAESDQPDAHFGHWVWVAGDVNGDGFDDVAVGATDFNNGETDEGRAYVYHGSASGLPTSPDWTTEGDQPSASFGFPVTTAGDVNGDGYDDVIVGANGFGNGQANEGRAFVYLGSVTGLATSPAWTAESDQPDAHFGISASTAGDVNGDGYDDVLVGAHGIDNGNSDEGRVYAYLGSATGLATSPAWTAEGDQDGALLSTVATAGDVNGDGYDDVLAGAEFFDGPEMDEGVAFLYLGSATGLSTSRAWKTESDQMGGHFGESVATAGDVNRDGYDDVIVGAWFFDNPEPDEGAAFLYLGVPSLVLYEDKISQTEGGFGGTLGDGDQFGSALASIGDVNGNLVPDLAVGAPDNEGAGTDRGGVWILLLNADGSVASELRIDDVTGSFGGTLDDGDGFGAALAAPGDLDADGIPDLLVGAPGDDDGGTDRGAVWILYLNADGTVKAEAKISSTSGGFGGTLDDGDEFGASIATLGNLDGAGAGDLAVGAPRDDDGGTDRGAVWILFLDASEAVTAQAKISQTSGGFPDPLANGDGFGEALAALEDLDGVGGGVVMLAVGAPGDDVLGADAGTVWFINLTAAGTVSSIPDQPPGSPSLALQPGDRFGSALANLGKLDRVGAVTVAVGAPGDDSAGSNAGALWLAALDASGLPLGAEKISGGLHHFSGGLSADDLLGAALASLGDSDGDGRADLVVGAPQDDDGGTDRGALWIVYLNDGTLHLSASSTTWTGATDTQWELASNWDNGVPDAAKTAIIPDAATTPNDPALTVTGQQCDSLWVEGGGMLDISAAMDSLGVFGGATVSGPITGTGELVFEATGTLAGDDTIGLTFDPAVRADADLELQGGPLTITGNLQGNADVNVAAQSIVDIGGTITIVSDLAIDGSLTAGDGVDVGGTLSSSASGELVVMGTGTCVVAGQLCFHGDITTSCSLSIERLTPDTTDFEAEGGWPASVSIDVAGTVNLITPVLTLGGDLVLVQGTFAIGVDGTIEVNDLVGTDGIAVQDGATFDVTGFQTRVLAPAPITVQSGGKLNIGAGAELVLEGNTLTIESGGTLCLDGVPADRAALSGFMGSRYVLDLQPGSTLAAKGFVFQEMSASGIVIGPGVLLAAAPYDLRAGVFDLPDTGGALLDITRSVPTQLRYLRFDNSLSAAGVKSVRTSLVSSVLTLVNWSGDLAPDAATAETFDDDPGESSPPERIVFAPPEESDVEDFTANWGPGHVKTSWSTLAEVDSQAFLVQRSPEPPGVFTTVGETPSVGASSYELLDFGFDPFAASRYRLYERLTHGELRLIDEVMLPASGIVLRQEGASAAPPTLTQQPLVVGPGGTYPDVRTALAELARGRRRDPATLVLAEGRHEPFELGRGLAFDLCLVARPGAVIDASHSPVRIEGLAARRSVELAGLTIDAQWAEHPALVVEDAQGVVLLQDVELLGRARACVAQLQAACAVAFQGGSIEGGLALGRGSHATASAVRLASIELRSASVLETRGRPGPKARAEEEREEPGGSPAFLAEIEPGSRWLARAAAPRLTREGNEMTLAADVRGLAWLGLAPRLGFRSRSRPWIEGVLLLDPDDFGAVGPVRLLSEGTANWNLGALPAGALAYLQGLVLDPASGRVCLSDVARVAR